MKKYSLTARSIYYSLLLSVALGGFVSTTARAVDIDFYQGNDILFYDPSGTSQCTPGSSMSAGVSNNGANGNRDYKGRQIISDEQLAIIKKNQPIYEKAANEAKIPWQILPVLHIRESVLADFNPGNGQGIYQDFARLGNNGVDYPPGPVTDEEFLRQSIWAAKFIKEKAGSKADLFEKGDPAAIKDAFFSYNGRAAVYIKQAADLGYDEGYEGSPYVMNIADEKRDPEVNKTTWGQIGVDLGPIVYPARGDYGAFIMYAALAGIPAGGGECTGSSLNARFSEGGWEVTGPNAMQIYYQDEEPWASTMVGPYSIKGYGCGPTSTAMAVATLNNDPSINPANMSQFFFSNGDLSSVGTHFSVWPKVAQRYGVTITDIGTDMSKAAEALGRGSFVIISADGCPFACAGGHILLLRGVTSSGNFLVADPNKHWGAGTDSNKTMNNNGYPITSAAANGIKYMWEIRKG